MKDAEANYLPEVRKQYEEYPYPERNPLDEKKRLISVGLDCLDVINHHCHEGKRNFYKGVRVLVAGGGTGDSTIFLAEQLHGTGSEIFYVDMSEASLRIARTRAEIRRLDNITWIHDSLLNIPKLNLGNFDHISCTGVLHHLEDPVAGIKVLESALSESGSINVMVYGSYGRSSIYQVQNLLRLMNSDENDLSEKIRNCRKILEELPPTHWHNLARLHEAGLPDVELYDLYLHSQDRAYTVPELHEFADAAGLQLTKLFGFGYHGGNEIYNPDFYLKDPKTRAALRKLSLRQRQAAAELINSRILMHSFCLTRGKMREPDISMQDYVPSLSIIAPNGMYELLRQLVRTSGEVVELNLPAIPLRVRFHKTPGVEGFFKYMDGERSLKSIISKIMADAGASAKMRRGGLAEEIGPVVKAMSANNLLFLRHKSVPRYKTSQDLEKQMHLA